MVNISAGGCPNVLDEGLAMVYDGPLATWDLYPSADVDILPLLTAEPIPRTPDAYMRAGHFASFLIENHGPKAVIELCNAIPRKSTISQWTAAIQKTLGTSLDMLIADYAEYPQCNHQQLRARLWGCAGVPDVAFSTDSDHYIVDSGCADPQTTNSGSYLGDALLLRRVYFEQDTWVEISARSLGDSGTGATYVSQECAPCSEDPQVLVELDDVDVQLFRAGLHEVSVFFDRRDPIRLSMRALP